MLAKLPMVTLLIAMLAGCTAAACSAAEAGAQGVSPVARPAIHARPLKLLRGGMWRGEGVAYGPHRDGQRPFGPSPSRAQIAEDLKIIASHWQAIRVYGAADLGDSILRTIKDEHLGLTVMLGTWLAVEASRPDSAGAVIHSAEHLAANRREINAAIRLAKAKGKS